MRHFSSYGPVDPERDFSVPRTELVERSVEQIVGDPDKSGHYFTIWAPRQTGKTWIMRRAMAEIRARHGDRFIVGTMSMQALALEDDDPDEKFLREVPRLFHNGFQLTVPPPAAWSGWGDLFQRGSSPFDRPVILLIDEFDSLPRRFIDHLVLQFRDLYLSPETTLLHGLALVGVRAVLGVDSSRGSPFNVQRSLHVPNLTRDEVFDMFRQYQAESGQAVADEVIATLYDLVAGQPGLVGWFGELLTEKYNPRPPAPITMATWDRAYAAACQIEPNNTLLNLLKKASGPCLPRVLEIFARTDVPFSFGQEWCNYLYLNGIIEPVEIPDDGTGKPAYVCRFSSSFVQQRLFSDLTGDLLPKPVHVLPLDFLDDLADVFMPAGLDVPKLLARYVGYLGRLKARGQDPWKDQPRRKDLHYTEAVGHFHLYAWLVAAVGKRSVVSPQFPTGNGTVDLVLRWKGHAGVIEVKSFTDLNSLRLGQEQAAAYALKLGVSAATLAVFVPTADEEVLRQLSGTQSHHGITVTTVAISWGE